MDTWTSIALYAAMVAGTGVFLVVLSALVGPRKQQPGKFEPYECGMPLLSPARQRFSVHFFLIAILFILFDIETVFLIPYAILHRELGVFGLVEMGIFVVVLGGGLAYLWKRGALKWE
jgi:NADH-quinone oxidoreductase subunit A